MKKSTLHVYLAVLTGLLLPATALAHPGHMAGSMGFSTGFLHPFTGADHLLAMVAVGIWAAQQGGRARWTVPIAFVTFMLIGGALGISAIGLPYIESGILVSILVLGFLVAGAFKFPLTISGGLVGVFAIFHGYAHGSEMPVGISVLSYSIGFAVATALLHGLGLGSGMLLQRRHDILSRLAGSAIVLGGLALSFS